MSGSQNSNPVPFPLGQGRSSGQKVKPFTLSLFSLKSCSKKIVPNARINSVSKTTISGVCGVSTMTQMNLFTKQKQTHRVNSMCCCPCQSSKTGMNPNIIHIQPWSVLSQPETCLDKQKALLPACPPPAPLLFQNCIYAGIKGHTRAVRAMGSKHGLWPLPCRKLPDPVQVWSHHDSV